MTYTGSLGDRTSLDSLGAVARRAQDQETLVLVYPLALRGQELADPDLESAWASFVRSILVKLNRLEREKEKRAEAVEGILLDLGDHR